MKVKALKSFEGIKDKERDVFPKEGDVWETTDERAVFLKSHGVIEIIEEPKKEEEVLEKLIEKEDKVETLDNEYKTTIIKAKPKKKNKK